MVHAYSLLVECARGAEIFENLVDVDVTASVGIRALISFGVAFIE